MGDGKPLAPRFLPIIVRTGSSDSSRSMASLLGAGVRLWLEPLVVLLGASFFEVPLICRDMGGRVDGTVTLACCPSTARFWKKLLIDFCWELEVDFLRVGGVLVGGLVGDWEELAIALTKAGV